MQSLIFASEYCPGTCLAERIVHPRGCRSSYASFLTMAFPQHSQCAQATTAHDVRFLLSARNRPSDSPLLFSAGILWVLGWMTGAGYLVAVTLSGTKIFKFPELQYLFMAAKGHISKDSDLPVCSTFLRWCFRPTFPLREQESLPCSLVSLMVALVFIFRFPGWCSVGSLCV